MFNNYAFEDYGELLESDESDEAYDEASPRGRPRGGRPPVKTPPRGNPVPKQAGQGFATKAELEATAARLDGRIATNSKGIETIDRRSRTLETENARLSASLRREIAERKTATDSVRKGLDDLRQMAMLLPLLSTQETAVVGGVQNVVVDNGDNFAKLLPILLMSGSLGGSSASAGSSPSGGGGMFGGGDGGGIATLAIVMALSGKK